MARRRGRLEENPWDLPEDLLEGSLLLRNEEWNVDPCGPPYMEEAGLLPDTSCGGKVVDRKSDHPALCPRRQWTRSPARTGGGALPCPTQTVVERIQEGTGELLSNVERVGVPIVVQQPEICFQGCVRCRTRSR